MNKTCNVAFANNVIVHDISVDVIVNSIDNYLRIAKDKEEKKIRKNKE